MYEPKNKNIWLLKNNPVLKKNEKYLISEEKKEPPVDFYVKII
jgi:hypothetical protein